MRNVFLSLCLLFLCTGCETLVEDFNLISVPQEQQIGQQAAAQVSQQMQIVTDPVLNQRIRSIGSRLVAALPYKEFNYEFFVVQDETPNAFTIPGGKIYVHTGLIKFADDEDELAGVIGHEVGHAFERHPAKNMSRAYGVDYISKLLFKGNQQKLQSTILQFASGGILNHYNREEELRADNIGFELLRRAGYRTDGLVRFFKKLMTMEGRGISIPFLSSHPPTPERISRLEALAQQASSGLLQASGTPQAGLVAPAYAANRSYARRPANY